MYNNLFSSINYSSVQQGANMNLLNNWYDPDFTHNYRADLEANVIASNLDFAFLTDAYLNCTQKSDDELSCATLVSKATTIQLLWPSFTTSYFNSLGIKNGDTFKWGCWIKFPSATSENTRTVYLGAGTSYDNSVVISNSDWTWVEIATYGTVIDSNVWQKQYLGLRYMNVDELAYIRGFTMVNLEKQEWSGELESTKWNRANASKFYNLNPYSEQIENSLILESTDQDGDAFSTEVFNVSEFGIDGLRITADVTGRTRINLNYMLIDISDVGDPINLPLSSGYLKYGCWLKINSVAAVNSVYFGNVNYISNALGKYLYQRLEQSKWIWIESPAIYLESGEKDIYSLFQIDITPDNSEDYVMFEVCGLSIGFSQNPLIFKFSDYSLAKLSQFYNLDYTPLGDSITALNKYQKYVQVRFGSSNLFTRGIGGTTIHNNGDIAWVDSDGAYLNRPPSDPPAGTEGVDYFEISSSMCTQDRIDTIPLTTRLFTVMGGVNDFFQDVPLGTINDAASDEENNTFYSAAKSMFDKLLVRIPNSAIFVINTPYCFNELTVPNTNGNYLEEYRQALREVAATYGFPIIETNNVGVNDSNWEDYSVDIVHPNTDHAELIGEKTAQEIASYS